MIKIENQLATAITSAGLRPGPIRKALEAGTESIYHDFDQGISPLKLVADKANLVDRVLSFCFDYFYGKSHCPVCCLVAVGGYGRRELLPGSDIDLMILIPDETDETLEQQLSSFLAFLWDIGLEVGYSVRTLDDCVREGAADITVITNMIESRLITGSEDLYQRFLDAIRPQNIWSAKDFFEAKLAEQQQRYLQFNDTAYNLEPNVKEGPGGLRDIHMIGWVAKRQFEDRSFHELVEHGFLTETEYQILLNGHIHLLRVRFALHRLVGRREDRLLFDYQNQLATEFGYQSGENNLAIEKFMQEYYRTIMELDRLNEMLLQIFREEILMDKHKHDIVLVNERFQLRNQYMDVRNGDVFRKTPSALLELFLLVSTVDGCVGVTASTIRLVRQHLYLVDDDFRRNPEINAMFVDLMSAPNGVTHQMRRMNSYGFLAAYIPAFGKIVGRMQYDLFHAYTVDQHTIFVIRNLRRFALDLHADEFPFCNEIFKRLERPCLLYIAALFHDIAKGRDGDHSVLGAEDAREFCEQHGFNEWETNLVATLVREHLRMSVTAQRKDISDPDVIHEFARGVGDLSTLNYLYLMTVADIRSTNPKLWNNWKDALLTQLFNSTEQYLLAGLQETPDVEEVIEEKRQLAFEAMESLPYDRQQIDSICGHLPGDYFLRHHPLEVRWHVDTILTNPGTAVIVSTRLGKKTRNSKVFVSCQETPYIFYKVTAALGELGLSVLNAEIFTTDDNRVMDTFIIQSRDNKPISDPGELKQIEQHLWQLLVSDETPAPVVNMRRPRYMRAFDHPTEISFEIDPSNNRTVMDIKALDMPGLLAQIAHVLANLGISISHAKIATMGEKAEDIFYLTDENGEAIEDNELLEKLRQQLVATIDKQKKAS